jgi:hypothetical protein
MSDVVDDAAKLLIVLVGQPRRPLSHWMRRLGQARVGREQSTVTCLLNEYSSLSCMLRSKGFDYRDTLHLQLLEVIRD